MSPDLRSVLRWVARQEEGIALDLLCAEHPDPRRGDPARTAIHLETCIGQVPAHEVLELLVAGAGTVLLHPEGCAEPETAFSGFTAPIEVLAAHGVNRLEVAAHGDDDGDSASSGSQAYSRAGSAREARAARRRRKARRPVLSAAAMPLERRAVLSLGIAGGPQRDLPDQFLSAPARLNTAVAVLTTGVPDASVSNPSGSVQLTAANCTACQVCVRACPSDALTIVHSGTASDPDEILDGTGAMTFTSLLQDPSACDGCGICVRMCPEDVLQIQQQWPWPPVREATQTRERTPIVTLATAQCSRCRTRFPTTSGTALCPVCVFRRENPFSSWVPPAS